MDWACILQLLLRMLLTKKCLTVLCVCGGMCEGSLHTGHVCSECRRSELVGIRWSCLICTDVHLCRECYGNDKHDVTHRFVRFDWQSSDGQVTDTASVTLTHKLTIVKLADLSHLCLSLCMIQDSKELPLWQFVTVYYWKIKHIYCSYSGMNIDWITSFGLLLSFEDDWYIML